MDDFPGILTRDFGFRPQGKSAPMAASKVAASGGVGSLDPGSGSTRSYTGTDSWNKSRSSWSSDGIGVPESHSTPAYDDVFGGSARYSNQTPSSHGDAPVRSSPPPSDFDSIFDGYKDPGAKPSSSSMPVYDKPVYDDDIFEGVPGLKSSFSPSVKYDDVFTSVSSGSNRAPTPPPYDDLLENLGKPMPDPNGAGDERSGVEKGRDAFDELIPGFGGSSAAKKRVSPEGNRKKTSFSSANTTANVAEDPFVVLESASTSTYSPSAMFTDPLEHIGRPENSGTTKVDTSSVNGGIFDDNSAFGELPKSVHSVATETNGNQRENTTLHDVQNMSPGHRSSAKEPPQRSAFAFESILPNMQYTKPSDSQKSVQRNLHSSDTHEDNMADQSRKFHNHMEAAADIWLTVAEIPLFTQPTSAPPPSRPPPPLVIKQSPFGAASKGNNNEDFRQSTQSHPYPKGLGRKGIVSPIDELEEFASGRPQTYAHDRGDTFVIEEETETTSAAAASAAVMKEVMDRAEAKFKHAKEVRERERDAKFAKNRESVHIERDEQTTLDGSDAENQENHERLDQEHEQKVHEEKEKEQRRLEREREQELERQRARQAVERATREARERAGAEARLKAERAAVEKAAAEARQRAERAAVQRAAAEARERAAADARQRAAADARQRAEKEAAEARERAAAEAREKAAREKAERDVVDRVSAEARLRAERAAVERASAEVRERLAAEARERAAAEARQKAASAAREKQQKPEDDLESFFGMGSRANSAPKQRAPSSETIFDYQPQNSMASDGVRSTTSGSSSTIKKASSTTNIVDDLTSIFGGAPPSGEFQEMEGETEDRRRARLERHHRTVERANKALAEKKERDLQNQREQQERHRIAETLDFEIKRWAAGKEGNLRALLSTLQYVLWPECGWQPVSLTDLITAAAVKKVYRKATLCIHPDKVQQKGATLQQKYIAEKVFDLLKEAWNKFNSEELF